MRGIASGILVIFLGCGPEETSDEFTSDQWLEDYPELFCAVQMECNSDRILDLYEGEESQCVDAIRDQQTERIEQDGCGFDGDLGQVCIDALKDMTCEDWDEGVGNCGEVVDCSSG